MSTITDPICPRCGQMMLKGSEHLYCSSIWQRVADILAQLTAMTAERDAWTETARQNQRNTDYYRGLVEQIGELFGVAAKTADDGGVHDSVLCAKVPELVAAAQERQRRLRDLIGDVIDYLHPTAEDLIYGAPHCDDPRDFQPDTEECTPEEIAAWKAACEQAERGEKVDVPHHYWISGEAGEVDRQVQEALDNPEVAAVTVTGDATIAHVAHEPWGIGTSNVSDPETKALCDKLRAALRETEQAKE